MSFWKKLNKPLFVLAPMADVTDAAYRKLIAETAKPDVFWTEFVSADGLYHTRTPRSDGTTIYSSDSENPLMRDLRFGEGERPIVAQVFGSNPETIEYAAHLAKELGFDGIDINMGCPDKAIEKQGAGAAMMKDPTRAREVIRAAKKGGIPVSVKTRIGFNKEEIDTWIPEILSEGVNVLTVHLRTRKELSKVDAHWEVMPRIVALRDKIAPDTLIFGNGDVHNLTDAKAKVEEYGIDGVMLGRAIFGNPWLFEKGGEREMTKEERIEALLTLSHYFDEMRPRKSFHIMKKHFKAFIHGWPGAPELRARLMECSSHEELEAVLKENT